MIRSIRRGRTTLLLVLLLAACGDGTGPGNGAAAISPQARAYLDQVLGLMQNHSINRLTINWDSFRATVFEAAAGAQTRADTYAAIEVALGLLGDGHSAFLTPTGTVIAVRNRSCSAAPVAPPSLPGFIGYVRVSAFSGTPAQAAAYSGAIHDAIRAQDHEELVGWIVDLRGNTGGNMWPMLAGMAPVLGEDTVGYFIDPTGAQTVWEVRDGASWIGGSRAHQVEAPYRLLRERPRVAVLTDNRVASSGEAVAIAFRQRPGTRSFGTATCGLSTANAGFPLPDGAVLNLTTSTMADRTRTAYGESIPPDEEVVAPDEVVVRAVAWLQTGGG